MRSWHPITKLVVALGVVGLAAAWLLDQGGPVETGAVGGRPAQAEGVGSPAVAPGRAAEAGTPGETAPVVMLAARILPPEASLDAMVSRPLFAPNRRPPDPAVEVAAVPFSDWAPEPEPEAGPASPSFRFVGSIVEDGRVRAIVSDGFNVRGVVVGEEVEGWTVQEIEERRLALASDGHELELTILE